MDRCLHVCAELLGHKCVFSALLRLHVGCDVIQHNILMVSTSLPKAYCDSAKMGSNGVRENGSTNLAKSVLYPTKMFLVWSSVDSHKKELPVTYVRHPRVSFFSVILGRGVKSKPCTTLQVFRRMVKPGVRSNTYARLLPYTKRRGCSGLLLAYKGCVGSARYSR